MRIVKIEQDARIEQRKEKEKGRLTSKQLRDVCCYCDSRLTNSKQLIDESTTDDEEKTDEPGSGSADR